MDKNYTQGNIDEVWKREWKSWKGIECELLFRNPLFAEGYATYARYIPKNASTFLELGAGSGRYGLAIARDNPHLVVTITDPLSEATGPIASCVATLNLTNATVREADMCKLPFPDNSFDVVFADAVIQHIIAVDEAVKEVHRVLKPGGVCIIGVVNSRNPFHALHKATQSLLGREYEYGYERTYTQKELGGLILKNGGILKASDGFYMAYGIYRYGYRFPFFKFISRIINRLIKILDAITGRSISKMFGFEIFCVSSK